MIWTYEHFVHRNIKCTCTIPFTLRKYYSGFNINVFLNKHLLFSIQNCWFTINIHFSCVLSVTRFAERFQLGEFQWGEFQWGKFQWGKFQWGESRVTVLQSAKSAHTSMCLKIYIYIHCTSDLQDHSGLKFTMNWPYINIDFIIKSSLTNKCTELCQKWR